MEATGGVAEASAVAGFCRYLTSPWWGATAKLSVGVQHQAIVRLLVGQIKSQNRVGL